MGPKARRTETFVTHEYGSGDETLLFVHGTPGDHRLWLPLVERAPRGLRLQLIDLPDHGQAEDLLELGCEPFEDALEQAVRALDGPVTLVGLSFGAHLVARRLARLGPRVRRAVLVAGFVALPGALRASRAGMAEALRQGALPQTQRLGLAAAALLGKRHRGPQAEARVREMMDGIPTERLIRSSERVARLGDDDAVPPYDVPCTVVHGTQDRVVPIACARALLERGRRAELVELDTDAHLPPFTHPEQLSRLVFDGTPCTPKRW